MSIVFDTYGALLIGTLTATFLSGMNTLQTILYFRLFPEDPIRIKASVSVVWSLDIIHTALTWVAVWTYFVANIGQIEKIDMIQTPDLVPGTIVVTAIVTLIVHLFYTQRIFLLGQRNYWISAPILLLALGRVGGAVATSVETYRAKRFSVFAESQSLNWVLSLGLVFGAATDITIMVAMFILLKSCRENSISLLNAIDKLILYTLEIGSVTAITAVASMIAWLTRPRTLIFSAFYLCIEKVYAISFMGSLLARYHLRQGNEVQSSHAWRMSGPLGFVNIIQSGGTTTNAQLKLEVPLQEIHVDVNKSIQGDDNASTRF